MVERLKKHVDILVERYPILNECKKSIIDLYEILEECYENDHKLGNLETKRAIMDPRDLVNALKLLTYKGISGDVYNISFEYVY